MAKIVVSEFISLDGVIETPQNWHMSYINEDMGAATMEQLLGADVLLYGRNTYDEMAGVWPHMKNNEYGIADKLNSAPKYVVSNTLQSTDWNHTTIISGDVVDAISKLKQDTDGVIAITGSGTLIASLLPTGLIDEYQLMVHPVVVGKGKHLFPDGADVKLKLTGTQTFASGVILLTYVSDTAASDSGAPVSEGVQAG